MPGAPGKILEKTATMLTGVLFVCLGNSCRSIMAEALARQLFPGSVRIGSAGLRPLGYIARETLAVLAEAGIDTHGLWSKGLTDLDLAEFPLLVNLTAYAVDSYLPRAFHGQLVRHPVVDPFGGTLEVYREARDTIRQFITEDLRAQLVGH